MIVDYKQCIKDRQIYPLNGRKQLLRIKAFWFS